MLRGPRKLFRGTQKDRGPQFKNHGPKRIKAPISHSNLSSNGTPVNIVRSAKYVGVIVDNELNFHEQIKVMEGKVTRSVEI